MKEWQGKEKDWDCSVARERSEYIMTVTAKFLEDFRIVTLTAMNFNVSFVPGCTFIYLYFAYIPCIYHICMYMNVTYHT